MEQESKQVVVFCMDGGFLAPTKNAAHIEHN